MRGNNHNSASKSFFFYYYLFIYYYSLLLQFSYGPLCVTYDFVSTQSLKSLIFFLFIELCSNVIHNLLKRKYMERKNHGFIIIIIIINYVLLNKVKIYGLYTHWCPFCNSKSRFTNEKRDRTRCKVQEQHFFLMCQVPVVSAF